MREFLLFGKGFTKVDQWQEGCWINVSDPNQDDFTYLEEMGVPESFISDIRDPNERPRVEKDDDWMLTIMRIPRETGDVDIPFSTVPLGVITNGDLVIVLFQKHRDSRLHTIQHSERQRHQQQVCAHSSIDYVVGCVVPEILEANQYQHQQHGRRTGATLAQRRPFEAA